MAGYVLGLCKRKDLKEIGFRLMIGRRIKAVALQGLSSEFAKTVVRHNLLADAVARVEAERSNGALLMLATASPDFYAREIALLLGFDCVVATKQAHLPDGDISFRIDGQNCYGEAKRDLIEKACAADTELGQAKAYRFYSDSASDAPTLFWANAAIAVNPGSSLRKLASKNGWDVVNFA
jgi:HAD superfamily phosphoserine phosphatase-like hydrolase